LLLDAADAAQVGTDLSTDIAVIGAGTVGLYLASKLRQRHPGCRITILEAGPLVASTDDNADASRSVGKLHGGTLLGRASGLGGTSTLWGGQLVPFCRSDLERDDAPWPLSFDLLEPRYREVYRDLGIGAPESDAVYRQAFGEERGAHSCIERIFTYWLKQPNFAVHFRNLIQKDPALIVAVNVTVTGLEFAGDQARRLRCRVRDGRTVMLSAKSFVFSAGTLSTVRFFLGTRDDPGVPWRNNAQIGAYFQDHLGGRAATVQVLDENRFRNFFENGWVQGVKLQPKLAFSEAHRRNFPIAVCGMFGFDSEMSQNLANLKALVRSAHASLSFSTIRSGFRDAAAVWRALAPIAWRFATQRRIFAAFDRGLSFEVQAEQIPIGTSRITLAGGGPARDGLPGIVVDWRCDGRELPAIHDFVEEVDDYLQFHGLASLYIDAALRNRDPDFIDRLTDTFHQCGGLRMSSSPADGVVDADCRVWGTDNVWIAGAAVFPSSSFANCTLTALALAARLADRLPS